MHTAKSNFSNFMIEYLGEYLGEIETNSKILKPVYQGPRWIRIMKEMEVENLVTHSL